MKTRAFGRVTVIVVVSLLGAVSGVLITRLLAQPATARIASEIDDGVRVTVTGMRPPMARRGNDVGRVAPETPMQGMSIVFKRSPEQEAALNALIAAQQDAASPLYHRWLTPDEFGARFGMDNSDLAKVEAWLQGQGFTVDGVSRGRDRIRFSGTAGQVQSAFGSELHYYSIFGKTHFAPSSDLSLPAALAPLVADVANLSDFRPAPRFRRPKANFTSSQSGHTFLTPKDVATVYDVNPAYTAGFNGAGQTIAVVGQTSVAVADMENFETAAGVPVKDPTLLLVPGSGNVFESLGDESESDLDLEYSGGMAPGASIIFVYVGDSANFTVFDSIIYAIDNDIAPIISDSYGLCEPALAAGEYTQLNAVLQQGAAQGQSIIVPTGDSGSPDCEGVTGLSTAQQEVLAIDFPASSQYVTAMGGSEFLAADVCNAASCSTPPATFWQTASGSDVISSALKYIPEQVWNDNFPPSGGNPAVLSSTGGGISTITPRPSWQNSLPGPGLTGSFRMVPDIALSGSPQNAGFIYCSSDTSLGISGSCSHGFRDVNSSNLTIAGGTSFDAPMFSGLVAVINQKENSVGQGVVSPTLYQLASNAATYASAFHDIASGSNNCSAAGSTVCAGSASTQYNAGTGYDLASGLGSIDFNNLLAAWPAGSALSASRITLSPATNQPAVNASDAIAITVASASGSGTPTGTVKVVVDGATANASLALSSGAANFNFVPAVGGSHSITVTYSGDTTFAPSVSTVVVDNESFRLTATNPTVASGASGSSTLTITPQGGYTGSISWVVSSSPPFTNGCFSLANASVPNSSAVSAPLSIKTSTSACGGAAMLRSSAGSVFASSSHGQPQSPLHDLPVGLSLGGLLFAGVFAWRPKRRGTLAMLLLLALTVGLPACGGGSSGGGGGSNVAPGTYNVTVVGTDTTNSTISGSAFVTVTVQ